MSENPGSNPAIPDDQTICFCHNVAYKTLVEAIRSGAVTHRAIQEKTAASTGCGGCTCEVLEILNTELARQKRALAPAE